MTERRVHAPDLFGDTRGAVLPVGAALLAQYIATDELALLAALHEVVTAAPFRQMVTPGGSTMSVAMTNCGALGWISDARGSRYAATDPVTGAPWPAMPTIFRTNAERAAAAAGYPGFSPDACLVNRYAAGAKMTLHQDKNERDFTAPIVSVSLGLPAVFQVGGLERTDRVERILLTHGDVLVWGGPSRLVYHGIQPLKDGEHPLVGRARINLTFRKAA
jgi:alkylated DNA repair protein (DNA oxidative demethylase)